MMTMMMMMMMIVYLVQVTGVLTQGRGDGEEWVKAFMISHSMDAFHWKYITDVYGNQRVYVTRLF